MILSRSPKSAVLPVYRQPATRLALLCMCVLLTASVHSQVPTLLGISKVNPDSNVVIGSLTDGDTINLSSIGGSIAFQAQPGPESMGSVTWALSGPENISRTDNTLPYSLNGDASGDFTPWVPSNGTYTLTATPWQYGGGTGAAGPVLTRTFTIVGSGGSLASGSTGTWSYVPLSTFPSARHECSFVQAGDQFLLMGGRGIKPVDAYDVNTGTWSPLNPTPQEIHHFQATSFYGLVYVMGAFEGTFPVENGIPFIYIYDPLTDSWFTGPNIPGSRVRGSAGLVLHNDVFYLAAGITNGHTSGWVPWLDAFDPVTNAWTILADAPRARDHFHAAVLDNKLVCAGGRRSGEGGSTFNAVVLPTDVYDFATASWSTLPSPAGDIPTGRAGTMSAVVDDELLVFGGESGSQTTAHNETEALDLTTGTWRTLDDLQRGRHGSQAIVSNGGVYVAAGSGNRGGSPELNTMEQFHFAAPTLPDDTPLTPPTLSLASSGSAHVLPGSSADVDVLVQQTSGNQAALIREISLAGDPAFSLPGSLILPFALPPAGSRSLAVSFAPGDTGMFAAELTVVYGGLGDTVRIALTGEGGGCDATQAPTGLATTIDGSGVHFSWNPVTQAEQCELSGRRAGTSGFAKLRFAVPPHSVTVGSPNFLPGTTYEWRVRCACSISPLSATPHSALASFTTPPPLRATETSPSADLLVHPVPAQDVLTLAWPSAEGRLQLQVQDAQGRIVRQESLDGSLGQIQLTRDGMGAGWYLVRLTGLPGGPVHRSLIWE